MKITDIKQQVGRKDRYSIFVDGKYLFSLSEGELLTSRVRIGMEFTSGELEELKQIAVLDKAYMRCLDLIVRRLRSEGEVREYLKRKEYTPAVIDVIIVRLQQSGYIDDRRFAESWVSNRRLLRNISKRKLRLELKQKYVNEEIVNDVLAEDNTVDIDVIREVVSKKRQQSKYQDDLKLMQYLARQGFNYDDIKRAMTD